ncbi:MAG TPA: zinc finger CCCH domain-containing protein [Flavobacteriales bacterium]|nr:zinc finger CCCH domain-containing protein [Flavobacteriales bacterium]
MRNTLPDQYRMPPAAQPQTSLGRKYAALYPTGAPVRGRFVPGIHDPDHPNYRTQSCVYFDTSYCRNGDRCNFIHMDPHGSRSQLVPPTRRSAPQRAHLPPRPSSSVSAGKTTAEQLLTDEFCRESLAIPSSLKPYLSL